MIYESFIWSPISASGNQNKFFYEENAISSSPPGILALYHPLRIQFFHWNLLIYLLGNSIRKSTVSFLRYCLRQNNVCRGWWQTAPKHPKICANYTHFQIYKCTSSKIQNVEKGKIDAKHAFLMLSNWNENWMCCNKCLCLFIYKYEDRNFNVSTLCLYSL